MSGCRLLIFAKYPTPGAVNTRLCPPLTPQQAADVQRACVRLLCERAFRSWPVQPVLVISPDDTEEAFREFVGPYIPIWKQGPGDLAERLIRSAKTAFDEGSAQVLIIGSDSPTISAAMLTEAQGRLGKADVVIGPCEDGGFYLMALSKVDAKMFDGVDWGTERVAAQARAAAQACGLRVAELRTWYDIDRPEDIKRTLEDLRKTEESDTFELRRLLEQVLLPTRTHGGGRRSKDR